VDLGQPREAVIQPNGSVIVEAQPYRDKVFIGEFEVSAYWLGVLRGN
jgi:hypothetical protein